MTVEEKAYNYASKVVKNRLTASEVAAHYGRGYIEGQEDMKHVGWHPASELPPVNEIGESETLIVYDLNGYAFSAFYTSKRGWCDEDGRNNLEIRWWCYPPEED